MKNGWTGGQYSLVRALFGVYLLSHFVMLMPYAAELFSREGVLPERAASPLIHLFPNVLAVSDAPWVAMALIAIAAVASIAFALGVRDRIAAVVVWYVLACLFGRDPLIANPSLPFVGWLLLMHATLPRAPFGSWAARGRVDPRGGWSFPPAIFTAAWIVMSAGYTYSGWTKLVSPSWVDGTAIARVLDNPLARPTLLRGAMLSLPDMLLHVMTWGALALELLFAPLALVRRARPIIWTLMLSMHIGLMTLIDFADLSFGMIVLHLFTFDPRWVPAAHAGTVDDVFYDGTCGLCHRAIRFLIAEDGSGTAFRYAPLGGDAFRAVAGDGAELPDSMVVMTAAGTLLVKSDGVLHLGRRLGGYWRVLATVAAAVPRPLRDRAYEFVARIRFRLFARPKEACPMLPPDLRTRFSA
jgi:predicted DCC family thiol-disulfide oxidoreductase YuxK